MNLEFRKPTINDAKEIATWKYDGIYSFYNNDKTEAKQQWALNIFNEENTFSIYNNDDLIANCCFDCNDEEDGYLFGIQMKPMLTGKGLGKEIVEISLNWGREIYKFNEIHLLVAKFNSRAIKVYEKLNFTVIDEFIWNVNGEEKEFLEMKKEY